MAFPTDDEPPEDFEAGNRYYGGRDQRVTRIIAAAIGVCQLSMIGVGGWIATTLMDLRDKLGSLGATYAVQMQAIAARLDRNEARDDRRDDQIAVLKTDVATLNGKTFRGVAGYGDADKPQP